MTSAMQDISKWGIGVYTIMLLYPNVSRYFSNTSMDFTTIVKLA